MIKFSFFLVVGLILRLVLSVFIYSGDVNNHTGWGKSILTQGSVGAYDRKYQGILQPTYPPLALYSFTTSSWAYKSIYSLTYQLNNQFSWFPSKLIWYLEDQDVEPAFQKLLSIMSDIGITVLIYALARKFLKSDSHSAFLAGMVYLFNPAVFYNSSLWGQLESPPVFFILLAVWLTITSKPLMGHAAMAMALLIKQSSLIFFPIFIIFSYFKTGQKTTLKGLLLQFIIFYISYLPFFNFQVSTINYPLQTYLNRIEVGSGSDYITDHAFNLWALNTKLQKISDKKVLFGNLNPNQIGKTVFIILYLILVINFLKNRTNKSFINLLGLVSMTAFMVLTRMHERYLAPTLPFLAVSAAVSPQLWPIYLLITLGHLYNMYHQWWYPTLQVLRPVFDNWNTITLVIAGFILCWISWGANYFDAVKKPR